MSELGITSYAYYWACRSDASWTVTGSPMGPVELVRQTACLGLSTLQLCENVAAFDPSDSEQVRATRREAERAGIRLQFGCRAETAEEMGVALTQASALGAEILRVVPWSGQLARHKDGGLRLGREVCAAAASPSAEGIRIAIENYPGLTDRELLAVVEAADPERVGITLDTANSVGRLADPVGTARLLAPRAISVHLKDYVVVKPDIGYRITGSVLGDGELDVSTVLDVIGQARLDPPLLLELWMDPEPEPSATLEKEADWVARSVAFAREVVSSRSELARRKGWN